MKKIMMVAISIAVLFGFAACENTPILPYGNEVMSVTLASVPDYLAGETVNPADIQFRVFYDDNTSKILTGAELGLKYTGNGTAFVLQSDASKNTFEVVYGADKVDGTKKDAWTFTISAVTLDKVTILIDPSAAKQTYVVDGNETVDIDGLAYSVKFANGNIKAIDPADLDSTVVTTWPITDSSFEVKSYAAGAETTTIVLKDTVDGAELSADWIVDVIDVDDVDLSDLISDVKLEYNAETKEIFEHVKSGAETKLSEVDYNIVITLNQSFIDEYMDLLPEEAQTQLEGIKNPVTIAKDAAERAEVEVAFTKYDAERTNVQKYGEGPYYATVTIGTGDSAYVKKDVPLTITFADDYPIEIKVEKVDQDTTAEGFQEKEYSAPGKVDAGDFKYTIMKWASDFTYTEEIKAPYETVGSSDITIENANILKGETGNHTVGFEYAHKTKTPVTIKFGDTSAATTTVKIASAE